MFATFANLFNLNKNKFSFYKLYFLALVFFAIIYWLLGTSENFNFDKVANNNSDNLTFVNALYFSFITQSTTGYGDITPKTKLTRIIVMCQLTCLVLYLII
jgi:voltage-gated potassium channel